MHPDTLLIHVDRKSDAPPTAQAVNPPLIRASTLVFGSLDEYRRSHSDRVFDSLRYGRSGTPTTFVLQRAMAELAGAETCIATSSGLSAITAVLGAHAGGQTHILVSDGIYGPARVFCEHELSSLGCSVEFFSSDTDIAPLIRSNTSLIYVETPSFLNMEMLDIRAVCNAARARGVPVAADCTWGTPLFLDAHKLGVQLCIHSATKYISGHSDVMLGLVTGSLTDMAPIRRFCDRSGAHAAPDACWLAMRGLRTLSVRLQRHQQTAMVVARWLQAQPQVHRVLFPALPADPGHALWREQFSGAAGPFSFELVPCSDATFTQFIDALKLFGLGTSWGGFESLVVPAIPHHLRGLATMPDEGRLVRLHVGLEAAEDLCKDLAQALARI